MKNEIPIWEKYSLSIEEASAYYGIGMKRLYNIINNNPDAEFVLEIGTHYRIKRKMFEEFLNAAGTI